MGMRGRIGESWRAFAQAFRSPELRRLQLAGVGSTLAVWAYSIAIAVYAYRADGAGAVGIVLFVRWSLAAVFAPWLSLFADRLSRRRVMLAVDWSRTALVAGMTAVGADRRLLLIIGLVGAQMFVAGALEVVIVVDAIRLLHAGNAGVGWLNTALGVGGLLGGLGGVMLAARKRLAGDFRLGLVVFGVALAVLATSTNPTVALLLFGAMGAGSALVDLTGMTLPQRAAPADARARAFGVLP